MTRLSPADSDGALAVKSGLAISSFGSSSRDGLDFDDVALKMRREK